MTNFLTKKQFLRKPVVHILAKRFRFMGGIVINLLVLILQPSVGLSSSRSLPTTSVNSALKSSPLASFQSSTASAFSASSGSGKTCAKIYNISLGDRYVIEALDAPTPRVIPKLKKVSPKGSPQRLQLSFRQSDIVEVEPGRIQIDTLAYRNVVHKAIRDLRSWSIRDLENYFNELVQAEIKNIKYLAGIGSEPEMNSLKAFIADLSTEPSAEEKAQRASQILQFIPSEHRDTAMMNILKSYDGKANNHLRNYMGNLLSGGFWKVLVTNRPSPAYVEINTKWPYGTFNALGVYLTVGEILRRINEDASLVFDVLEIPYPKSSTVLHKSLVTYSSLYPSSYGLRSER